METRFLHWPPHPGHQRFRAPLNHLRVDMLCAQGYHQHVEKLPDGRERYVCHMPASHFERVISMHHK